ncbi:uncharacterized protein LACBIDRAFT_299036 [Laccaria bicolor S238N-H82]|uniref:Predicted protein n=1 Tax=Laccaria bicolor (strain S238N-H82 / ATCC MYA-4686) TaxID=486041 RepID=B0DDW4_LACBS|nr:uncharacterized protein LACBIDRAFT_299036 [Laccaria bicolor S238N-H82]EDR07289.1 predicted protein [Laccaria bicolor S238N-H82]|eukprot:XP_001882220.1 predicted protein [Laccaria bicolor S238N-H82]
MITTFNSCSPSPGVQSPGTQSKHLFPSAQRSRGTTSFLNAYKSSLYIPPFWIGSVLGDGREGKGVLRGWVTGRMGCWEDGLLGGSVLGYVTPWLHLGLPRLAGIEHTFFIIAAHKDKHYNYCITLRKKSQFVTGFVCAAYTKLLRLVTL